MRRSLVALSLLIASALLSAAAHAGACDPDSLLPRISDLTDNEAVRIVVVGDTGAKDFARVGPTIAAYCAEHACDLAVLLGDNFYLPPFSQGPGRARSRAFKSRFERPLQGLPEGFDVWAVMGNHGYRFWGSPKAQINHSYLPRTRDSTAPDWLMPCHGFKIPKLPPWLTLVGADTQLVLKKSGQRYEHVKALKGWLREGDEGWRVLIGHHPFHTSGQHGEHDDHEQAKLRGHLGALVADEGVQVVFSGHDHHQEFILAPGFVQVIQGAGSKDRQKRRTAPLDGATSEFFTSTHRGFGIATFTREALNFEYFGMPISQEPTHPTDGRLKRLKVFTCRRTTTGPECSPGS